MNPEHMFVLCLATWRITNLLVNERGPFRIFEWLREQMGLVYDPATDEVVLVIQENEIGQMLQCPKCTSAWVAALLLLFFWLAPTVAFWFCLFLSMSAAACVLNRYVEES